jgi:hypothetical protein
VVDRQSDAGVLLRRDRRSSLVHQGVGRGANGDADEDVDVAHYATTVSEVTATEDE